MNIRRLNLPEYDKAVALSLEVFTECGTVDFDASGLETFRRFIGNKALMEELTIFGAFDHERLIGVIGTKNGGAHISLFFIASEFQCKNVGRKLFAYAYTDQATEQITVNSSSRAVEFYESLGFSKTAEEQETNGLRYTPMARISNNLRKTIDK